MTPVSANAVNRAGPGVPRFVLMTITPLLAAVPYRVEAAGPITTWYDSISLGSMSSTRLGLVPPMPMLDELLALSMRTPSMM